MHASVKTVVDAKRGCGYRVQGKLYIRSDNTDWMSCGKLPVPLDKPCPCCGGGIRITRGLQKVNWKLLSQDKQCSTPDECKRCLANVTEFAWLISVGEKFYKTPGDFTREALEQGISKRIHAIPRGFKVGESVVLLAHKHAVVEYKTVYVEVEGTTATPDELLPEAAAPGMVKTSKIVPVFTQGIFSVFKPTRVEYVVKGDEADEQIESLVSRGITPVHVVRDTEVQSGLLFGNETVETDEQLIEDKELDKEMKEWQKADLMREDGCEKEWDDDEEELEFILEHVKPDAEAQLLKDTDLSSLDNVEEIPL